MKTLLVTDKAQSSAFAVRDIFFVAGVSHDVKETSPLGATADFAEYNPDFIIIESLENPDFTKRVIEQMRTVSGGTPIFLLHHGQMHNDELNANIETEFRKLGIYGFANTHSDFDQVGTRLLKTAGIEPPRKFRHINKRDILVGDIRFDLIAKKAYLFSIEDQDHADDHNTFASFAHTSQRMMFNARSQVINHPPINDQNALFDLSDEEVAMLYTLSLRQGDFIPRKDIIRFMQADRRMVPDVDTLDTVITRLIGKISDHKGNYGDFILHRNNRYCLNEIDMPLTGMHIDLPNEDGDDHPDPNADDPDLRAVMAEEYGDVSSNPVDYSVYPPSQTHLTLGSYLRINTTTEKAYIIGQHRHTVQLNPEEIALVDSMLATQNNFVNSRSIADNIYTSPHKPSTKHVGRLVQDVNKKLKSLGFSEDLIKSVRGKGFCINAEFISPEAPAPRLE